MDGGIENFGAGLDPRGPGIIAILGFMGATAGAVSAVLVYALCARKRTVTLNWFEKDLLNRAEEAEKLSNEKSSNLHPGNQSESEWQSQNGIFNNQSMEKRSGGSRHLSECSCDEPLGSPKSPLAPPLPGGGALVASEERMVILRDMPELPLKSSHSSSISGSEDSSINCKLSNADSDEDISSPCSPNETRGELDMSVAYDKSTGILTVKLLQAHDIRARDMTVRLLVDQKIEKQEKMHKKTVNPEFNEEFTFQLPVNSQLGNTILEILLTDYDSPSDHPNVGYVQIPLATINDLGLKPRKLTKSVLQYGTEDKFNAASLGELMVSLLYQPKATRLNVIVIRARNLFLDDYNETFEPYVQVSIIRQGKIIKSKKTNIIRDGSSPVWSENLSFDLTADILSNSAIEFSICRGNGQLFACCEISENHQNDLFHRVLAGGGASAQWLPLREPHEEQTK